MLRFFVIMFCFVQMSLFAEEQSPNLPLSDFKLDNGMRVLFKEMETENDEILIGLYARGGYAALPVDQQPSGRLSAMTAWESGLGSLNIDHLSVLLYEQSIEFDLDIQPFRRSIEAVAYEESLGTVFKMVNLIFTRPNFERTIFDIEQEHTIDAIERRYSDFETTFEEAFLAINTQQYPSFKPLTLDLMKKADFETSKQFFLDSYSNPADFVCIIVGPAKQQTVEKIVKTYLGAIPTKPSKRSFINTDLPTFPKGVSFHTIQINKRPVSATRLTFPILNFPINENSIREIELVCQLLEARLRKMMIQRTFSSRGIGVSYEFPYYPLLDYPWISIQFQSEYDRVDDIVHFIMEQVKSFQDQPPSQEEIAHSQERLRLEGESWRGRAEYWLAAYANDILWGWNPSALCFNDCAAKLPPDDVRQLFVRLFNFKQYTRVTTKPTQ